MHEIEYLGGIHRRTVHCKLQSDIFSINKVECDPMHLVKLLQFPQRSNDSMVLSKIAKKQKYTRIRYSWQFFI